MRPQSLRQKFLDIASPRESHHHESMHIMYKSGSSAAKLATNTTYNEKKKKLKLKDIN
jgi:hypothetical protein